MKHFSKLLISVLLSCIGQQAMAQAKFPCDGRFYMTRQYPSVTNTYISEVQFVPGDINISNPGTIAGSRYTNSSVFYNGYIWTQDWTNTTSSGSFKLIKVASDYSVTSYTIAGMPTGTYNNAGVTSNGLMYMMVNMQLYAIDLTLPTPAIATGFPKTCTMTPFMDASGYNWGDLAIDPTNNNVYIWYHPTGVTLAYKGLYRINNISGTTPSIDKVNGLAGQVNQTMGSMMFNDKGQLFSYGSPDLANPQDRFWAIDKQTGLVTQYGAPDLAVTQTDGCTCAFRISLEKSTSTPLINLSKCGSDSFRYVFRTDNYTLASVSGLTLRDTLDARLNWVPNVSSLQTQLQAVYGGSVSVSLSSYGSGSNNVLTVSNMTLPVGQNVFSVPVYLTANGFSGTNILYQQAYLTGLSVDLGSTEPSDYPTTFTPHDATPITINISGSLCRNPVADNYTLTTVASRMSAVAVAAPVASDADGSITQINVLSTPANGFLSYFDGVNTNSIGGAISLTPTEAGTMKYTPTAGAVNSIEVFTYQAVDNSGLSSNTATYAIPVRNNPPLANNIILDEILNTAGVSAIQPLSAGDEDGVVSSYTITSVPNAATQGTLSYCSNGSSPCTGSYIDITTAGTILTPAKAATLRFTPVVSYTGNVLFSYTATDNSSYTSNSATYIIPVHSTYSNQHQPLADNVVSQPMSNSLAATGIPSLKARDVDGTISSFTIISIPNSATQGTLKLCNPSCSNVTVGQVIAVADIANLSFDPLSTFTGNATFKYIATDNESIVSDTAVFTIEVVNMPPTAVNVSTIVTYNSSTAAISPIGGSDKDGAVDSAIIISLPASGTLKLCTPSCTNITLNQRLVPSNFGNLSFQPASGFTGTVTFQYKVRDNNGNYSQPATYTIQVPNAAPIADDIVNATLANTAASTGISSLTAADPDGSISSYQIQSVPLAVSGILYAYGSPVTVGQTVTASSLQFDPAVNYTGVASFSYIAFDNNFNASNIATVQIPVSGVGNLPPVVKNIQGAALSNTILAFLLNALTAVDPEGGIVTYNIESVPPASQGTLTYCSSGTVPCLGSTITLSGPVTGLSALQVATIKWTPSSSFVGTAQFTYTAVDILGAKGNTAAYLLPVTNLVPASSTVLNTTLANTSGAVSLNALSSTDPDGTISNYIIQTVPPVAQGALTLCNPGCATVTANQVISPADISNLKFDPAYTFTGDVLFNYISVDNNVQRSNVAVYTIPVTSLPPVAKDVVNSTIYNIASNSAVSPMVATDADGSIASYVIHSIPTSKEGVLSLSGTPVYTNQVLSTTDINNLTFTPNQDFAGYVSFNYSAIDNLDLQSNIATVVIPVTYATLAGHVYHDANGLTDNLVSGSGTNDSGTYVSMVNMSNVVVAISTVAVDGTFTFRKIKSGSFTFVLSTTQGTVGSAPPAVSLTSGWVNTGEHLGAPAGSDGTVNGILPVTISTQPITDVNFGIEQLPTPSTHTAVSVVNPGGTDQALVPASTFAGTDPDGTVDSIRISSFPSNTVSIVINGVSYTSGTFPVSGVTISAPGGIPAVSITIDPVDGAVSADIPYVAKDNAGKESTSTGHAHQPFTTVNISGTLFDDFNGTTDNLVNGMVISAGLNAVLVDANGLVMASVAIAPDGTYSFSNLNGGTYRVDIGMAGTPGAPAPGPWLPANWVTTSEAINPLYNDGTPNGSQVVTITNGPVTNINFGCEKIALADTKTYFVTPGPGSSVSNVTIAGTAGEGIYGNKITMGGTASTGYIPGQLTGTDPDGAAGAPMSVGSGASISFTIDPTTYSATDSSLNMVTNGIMLLYNGIQLQAGGCQGSDIGNAQCSYYNAANGLWEIPGYTESNLTILSKGYVQGLSFSYSWKDAANKQGVAALYQVSFATPLAVHLLNFHATATGDHQATINWQATNESNGDYYGIERSTDGIHFTELGSVQAQGSISSADYSFRDNDPAGGINYYRLHLKGQDGSSAYSAIRSLTFGSISASVSVYPNPVTNGSFSVALNSLEGTSVLDVIDMNGRIVTHADVTSSVEQVVANGWAPGIYTVSITNNGQRYTTLVRIQ